MSQDKCDANITPFNSQENQSGQLAEDLYTYMVACGDGVITFNAISQALVVGVALRPLAEGRQNCSLQQDIPHLAHAKRTVQ